VTPRLLLLANTFANLCKPLPWSRAQAQGCNNGVIQFFDKRKKIMQFALIFELLGHGHPMIEYIAM
jgi:hypothetical protein